MQNLKQLIARWSNLLKKDRRVLVVFTIVVLVFLFLIFLIFLHRSSRNKDKISEHRTVGEKEELIPTVSEDVKVSLRKGREKGMVILTVESVPGGTKKIEYELTYETATKGLQGVIGSIQVNGGKDRYERKIFLGTKSSGSSVYHKVVGGIKLTLKFIGSYGEKIFEKDFEI